MSVINHPSQMGPASGAAPKPPAALIPPLREGDRLTQNEFHRRYESMPEDVRAELISGVVHMASPVLADHVNPHSKLAVVLGLYAAETAGADFLQEGTVILGGDSEPEPDLWLRLLPEFGGRMSVNAKGYYDGPPELVIEIANTTAYIDLGPKMDDYRRAGVLEYLVLVTREKRLRTFNLAENRETAPDADGIWRSQVFPGLWIDAAAAADADQSKLLTALRLGLATPEHAAFVADLQARRRT